MYENEKYEVILERMLARVSDKLDKREGAVIFDALSPAAIEFQILYIELENILKEAYGDTASRECLILRCKERGISPKKATCAILQGEFMPVTVDVTGKRFNIGSMNYRVLKQISSGRYEVQCETEGSIGNQYIGSMIPIEYIAGLETATLTKVLVPGEDEEETESLRQRYFASFDSQAFGGNRTDYKEKVNAIAGVGCTKVTPVWNAGIAPDSMIPSAQVGAWYSTIADTLESEVAAWLSSVYTASQEKKLTTGGTVKLTILDADYNRASDTLINQVQEVIDPMAGEGMGLAPIGHIVKIDTAIEKEVYITTVLAFRDGYSWLNLQSAINDIVEKYLQELRKTWADEPGLILRISQIETRLLAMEGIIDVRGTKINGSENNLILDSFEIPVLGGVSE